MSDHAWILENLAAYLADGLEPAERDRLEQHTAECAACAAAWNEARAMDATLTGLFVEARPSMALEDRVIQTLRNRPPDSWRLPMPAWLALAAAALVLIGFTGAVASQILVPNGLASLPTGSMATNLLGYQKQTGLVTDSTLSQRFEAGDVNGLAEQTRQSMLSDLGSDPSVADTTNTPARRVPNAGLGGWSEGEKTLPPAESPPPNAPPSPEPIPAKPQPPVSQSYNGRMGLGWGDGSPRAVTPDGSPRQPTYLPPVGAGPPPATRGTQPGYFEPGKSLLATGTATAPNGRDGKPASAKGSGGGGAGKDEQLKLRIRDEPNKDKAPPPPPDKKPQGQAGPRKIVIRTGEVEYEVQSFDAAVATITRLVKSIKGGFLATVNSDKLTNGKVRGSVVVRVPPESLDELILDLRTNLGKSGELKNQRIRSDDITKQYTDLESRLKAARAMEERLLKIIKDGKGEIKDLLAVEKELGVWRTRIEEFEGSLRYYANQVALSTLTITLYEKEIQAPFGIVEREQVQMGIEVEDVDKSYQAAQKAVREAKGRITYSKLDRPSEGQYSAHLHFEVSPDAAGPLRDRLKQLGTVARFDIARQEETQGGTGKPSDGKITRNDTRFQVHFYNLTNVAPRDTVQINLACEDVEASLKKLLAHVEKAAGRVVSSSLNSARGDQAQSHLQIEVKSAGADAMLEDIKAAGEVMRLNVTENPDRQNTTRKKRGFNVQLLALSAAAARETDEIQLACTDVATSFRAVQEAVLKAKGRVRNAQLNEQDRRKVTATLDFEIRREDEAALRAALATAGDIYTRKAIRAADAENVVDSKVHWSITFINQATIPPRETYVFGVEVADVDQTAKMLSALVGDRQGRVVEANVSRERSGRVTGKLIYDVSLAKVHELLDALKSAGAVRVQQSVKHPEVPDSPLAIARLEVTLSNQALIVPTDKSFGASIHSGLSDSFTVLSWSVRLLILGLCVLLPWALVVWAIYRLVVRMRRRSAPAAPAT